MQQFLLLYQALHVSTSMGHPQVLQILCIELPNCNLHIYIRIHIVLKTYTNQPKISVLQVHILLKQKCIKYGENTELGQIQFHEKICLNTFNIISELLDIYEVLSRLNLLYRAIHKSLRYFQTRQHNNPKGLMNYPV
jgi:hypothetical protein